MSSGGLMLLNVIDDLLHRRKRVHINVILPLEVEAILQLNKNLDHFEAVETDLVK